MQFDDDTFIRRNETQVDRFYATSGEYYSQWDAIADKVIMESNSDTLFAMAKNKRFLQDEDNLRKIREYTGSSADGVAT